MECSRSVSEMENVLEHPLIDLDLREEVSQEHSLRNSQSMSVNFDESSQETRFSSVNLENPTLGDVLRNHPRVMKYCDVRKLIQWATLKGWIRVLEEYPAIDILTNVSYF